MNWLEQLAGAPGILAHGGIAAAVLLETGLFPTGADFLLILLVASRPEEWWIVFLAAAVGSMAGSALGYSVGRGIGRPLIRRVLPQAIRDRIERLYRQHDRVAVGVGGILPFVPFKHVSLTAGFFGLPFARYFWIATVSRTIRFFGLALISRIYQDQTRDLLLQHGWTVLVVFLVLGALAAGLTRRLA